MDGDDDDGDAVANETADLNFASVDNIAASLKLHSYSYDLRYIDLVEIHSISFDIDCYLSYSMWSTSFRSLDNQKIVNMNYSSTAIRSD